MDTYIIPMKIALIFFPIMSVLMTLPFLALQYHKYRYINKFRAFIFYTFILYCLCAYFLVILPLPEHRDIISLLGTNRMTYRLIPFASIQDIIRETSVNIFDPTTYLHLLKEGAFLQVVFNFILTVPIGVYLRCYFKKSLKFVVIASFLTSLFFELSQLTGLFGIYNAPYRLFELDDLCWNTLGGVIGYFIAPIFTYFMPNTNKLDGNVNKSVSKVTLIRRTVAVCIDWFIIYVFTLIIQLFNTEVKTYILYYIIIIFAYFVIQVYITNGFTIGKRIVKIKLTNPENKLSFKSVLFRYSSLYFVLLVVNKFPNYIGDLLPEEPMVIVFVAIATLFIRLMVIINFIGNIKSKKFFHDKLSGFYHISI